MSALSTNALQGYHDDPIVNSPFALVTTLNVSIFTLFWYIAVTHWNLANYVSWVRYNGDVLGSKPSPQLYLTFCVISEIILWLVAGPLLFYTAKYRRGDKDRNKYLSIAVTIAVIGMDVPLWLLDLTIVYYHGMHSVVQVATLILRSLSFFFGCVIVWQIYLHRICKYLQSRYENKDERRLIALAEDAAAMRKASGVRYAESKLLSMVN